MIDNGIVCIQVNRGKYETPRGDDLNVDQESVMGLFEAPDVRILEFWRTDVVSIALSSQR